tara:strand:- start:351 stop:662 length:312 start_codon:yes stop_codon:yes gene_type:complete
MVIIEYGQQNFLLTRWTDCWDRQSEARYWLNQEKRVPASVVISMKGTWSAVIYLPDGEVLDVVTTKKKREAQILSSQILQSFVEMCSTTLLKSRDEFKEWLDI